MNGQNINDTYAMSLLQPLISGYPFLPFTIASLRPFCLLHIINDIVINQRKSIIEFGSGISTIMIGRLIRKNNMNTRILSIEHSEGWANLLRQILVEERLDEFVTVVDVPLKDCSLAAENNQWYDANLLDKYTDGQKFDMVIVDGPPAWEKGKGKARYPALPYIKDKLCKRHSVYLDDSNRPGEQSIIQRWDKELGTRLNMAGKTLAYYKSPDSFYTEPFAEN